MYSEIKHRDARRKRRKMSVRRRVRGTAEKPRMSVFKSNKHLFVQLIDDENGRTLLSASTIMKELEKPEFKKKSKEAARYIGGRVADQAKGKNIQAVIFDRGHNKYHGLLAEVANAAREAGLQF
jgi:large subunit ribosomal protein L18